MKDNVKRKISLILLIVLVVNIILPNYSHAGSTISSLITKPTQTFGVLLLDGVNTILSLTFASDDKFETLKNNASELASADKDSGIADLIIKKYDQLQDLIYEFFLSPEDIFYNRVKIANANLFEEPEHGYKAWTSFGNLMNVLKESAAGLYYVIRNLAVVLLLCLLIYTGIRIVMSSNNAAEKAKWRTYLFDWLKALALVMFIHVIMIGVFYIAQVIMDVLKEAINPASDTIVAQIRKNFNDTRCF